MCVAEARARGGKSAWEQAASSFIQLPSEGKELLRFIQGL